MYIWNILKSKKRNQKSQRVFFTALHGQCWSKNLGNFVQILPVSNYNAEISL